MGYKNHLTFKFPDFVSFDSFFFVAFISVYAEPTLSPSDNTKSKNNCISTQLYIVNVLNDIQSYLK